MGFRSGLVSGRGLLGFRVQVDGCDKSKADDCRVQGHECFCNLDIGAMNMVVASIVAICDHDFYGVRCVCVCVLSPETLTPTP